jgi:SAM-dependent methyltransferase
MPAHDPNGRRFGEAAAAYERGRPEYPRVIVDWLLAGDPTTVVDLGAGTGKLTRALVDRVDTVVAVEPDPHMRRALSQALPGTSVLAGTGEDLPLRDGYADAVLVGQAWHWIDPDQASPEVGRVLRPGGVLGLVWNDRDDDDSWVQQLSTLLHEFGTSPDADYQPRVEAPFGPLEATQVRWTAHVSVEGVVDMVSSRSYVIALPADRRAELVARVQALAVSAVDPGSGLLPVPYVTRGYRAVRP